MYLMVGTVIFAEWEDWDYLDAAYFCVTSLLKVGHKLMQKLTWLIFILW